MTLEVGYSEYVTESNIAYCLLTEDGEPSTFYETTNNLDASLWMIAIYEEIKTQHKNKTGELVPLSCDRKVIDNK